MKLHVNYFYSVKHSDVTRNPFEWPPGHKDAIDIYLWTMGSLRRLMRHQKMNNTLQIITQCTI